MRLGRCSRTDEEKMEASKRRQTAELPQSVQVGVLIVTCTHTFVFSFSLFLFSFAGTTVR